MQRKINATSLESISNFEDQKHNLRKILILLIYLLINPLINEYSEFIAE